MKWLNKLERKFGRYAIPNLMTYIIILYIVGFIFSYIELDFYGEWLALDVGEVLRGQVWRLVTFIIQPPDTHPLFVIFVMLLYYTLGRQLELAWGAFRFNLYFITGVLFHIIAAFLAYALFKVSLPMGTYYLNLSLFFAFAAMFPNEKFYIMMIIPVKVKWLAWIDAVFFGYTILRPFLPPDPKLAAVWDIYYAPIYRAAALEAFVSLLNFLIFFFATRNRSRYSPQAIKRRRTYKKEVNAGRKEMHYENGAKHKCAVCGRTELDDETLEFRYCSKCNGNYEYCQDHLFTHEHVK